MPEPGAPHTARACGPVRIAFALAVAAVLLAAGCGRKLPPIQPGSYPPPAVKDLGYRIQGEEIVLTWTVPAAAPEKDSPAVGFKVLRSRQTEAEAECQSCPPTFQEVGNVRPSGPAETGDAVQHAEGLEPGYRYQFKVRGYTALNREGRDSNVVHVKP